MEILVSTTRVALIMGLGAGLTALNTSDTKHNQLKKKQKQINKQTAPGMGRRRDPSPRAVRQLHLPTAPGGLVPTRPLNLLWKIVQF